MSFLQIIEKYGEVISITLMPFIIWVLGIYFQNRKAKKDAKMNLFLRLMALRKSNPVSKEWADCLNQIDVVFQDIPAVRVAWRNYYDSLNVKSPHFGNQNSFQLDLLSEIGNTLGYKNLRQTDIDRYYSPVGLSFPDLLLREKIRVLTRSKSYGVEFTDDEYEDHIEPIRHRYPGLDI